MTNSRGFNNKFPKDAVAAKYDSYNGEFTGEFYFSVQEAELAEQEMDGEQYSAEEVNDSGWVSKF